MIYVDTRGKNGANLGGRVSVHPPTAEDLELNPYACARLFAVGSAERAQYEQLKKPILPPLAKKRVLAG